MQCCPMWQSLQLISATCLDVDNVVADTLSRLPSVAGPDGCQPHGTGQLPHGSSFS
jgi:hypothetical protein